MPASFAKQVDRLAMLHTLTLTVWFRGLPLTDHDDARRFRLSQEAGHPAMSVQRLPRAQMLETETLQALVGHQRLPRSGSFAVLLPATGRDARWRFQRHRVAIPC